MAKKRAANRFTVTVGGAVKARIGGYRLDIPLANLPGLKQLYAQLHRQGFEPVQLGWIINEVTTPTPAEKLIRQIIAEGIPDEQRRLITQIHRHWVSLPGAAAILVSNSKV